MSEQTSRALPPPVFHILISLADGERHGYAIMQEVTERTDGQIKLSPGNLYGSIKRMLEEELIEEVQQKRGSDDDERRRYYRITKLGRKAAAEEMDRLSSLLRQARATSLRGERA